MNTQFKNARIVDEYDYHADIERIGKSGLDLIHKAPIKYFLERIWHGRKPMDTNAMKLGRYHHCVLFEPEKIDDEFYILREKAKLQQLIDNGAKSPRATSEYKSWLLMEQEKADGKTIIPEDIYDQSEPMRQALMRNKLAAELIRIKGEHEFPIKWISENGVPMKSKLDKVIFNFHSDIDELKEFNGFHIIVDYKTCEDASPIGFKKSIHKYRYDVQDALYCDALSQYQSDGNEVKFVLIAQEKSMPYLTELFIISDEDRERAREMYLEDLEVYKNCMEKYKRTSDPMASFHGYNAEPKLNLTFLPNWDR